MSQIPRAENRPLSLATKIFSTEESETEGF